MPVLRPEASAKSCANPAHRKRHTRALREAIRTALDQECAEKRLQRGRRDVPRDIGQAFVIRPWKVPRAVRNDRVRRREREFSRLGLRFGQRSSRDDATRSAGRCGELRTACVRVHLVALRFGLRRRALRRSGGEQRASRNRYRNQTHQAQRQPENKRSSHVCQV